VTVKLYVSVLFIGVRTAGGGCERSTKIYEILVQAFEAREVINQKVALQISYMHDHDNLYRQLILLHVNVSIAYTSTNTPRSQVL
jgi:hypothetical protein